MIIETLTLLLFGLIFVTAADVLDNSENQEDTEDEEEDK